MNSWYKLQETLHTHCRIARGRLNPNEPEYSPNELNNDGSTGRGLEDQNTQSKPSLLRNRPLMAIIIVYCVFSLQEIAYSEVRQLQFTSLSKLFNQFQRIECCQIFSAALTFYHLFGKLCKIFSLWAVSDISYGGLSFSSQDVGQVLAISGACCILLAFSCVQWFLKRSVCLFIFSS